jgi:BirA family biotin operon repressor/biotin-[acetyl-CoA-carboxylase] ligase
MKRPSGPIIELREVVSTQDEAKAILRVGKECGVLFAQHQTSGRGRFDRPWISHVGDSLTVSLVLDAYAGHPKPHLVGMTVALASAKTIASQVRWPNDLCFGNLKVGGVLTEIFGDRRIPVVGIGINLNQTELPESIASQATSVVLNGGKWTSPFVVANRILEEIDLMPEPDTWESIATIWHDLDTTAGKKYKLHDGQIATAAKVGLGGELICHVDGTPRTVLAADALFG